MNPDVASGFEEILYDAGFLKSSEGAFLLDGAKSASRDRQNDRLLEFWDVNTLLLEVWIASDVSGRIELGCTSSV